MWDLTAPDISAEGQMSVMSRYVLETRNKSERSRDCNNKKKCEICEDCGSVTEVMGEELL